MPIIKSSLFCLLSDCKSWTASIWWEYCRYSDHRAKQNHVQPSQDSSPGKWAWLPGVRTHRGSAFTPSSNCVVFKFDSCVLLDLLILLLKYCAFFFSGMSSFFLLKKKRKIVPLPYVLSHEASREASCTGYLPLSRRTPQPGPPRHMLCRPRVLLFQWDTISKIIVFSPALSPLIQSFLKKHHLQWEINSVNIPTSQNALICFSSVSIGSQVGNSKLSIIFPQYFEGMFPLSFIQYFWPASHFLCSDQHPSLSGRGKGLFFNLDLRICLGMSHSPLLTYLSYLYIFMSFVLWIPSFTHISVKFSILCINLLLLLFKF